MASAVLRVRDENGNVTDITSIKGADGKSAYQYAVEGGYKKTQKEFYGDLANVNHFTAQKEFFNTDNNVFVFAEDGNSFTSGINQYVSKMLYIHFNKPVESLSVGTRIAKIEIMETENSEYVSLASKCVDIGFPLIPLTQEVTSSDYGDVIFTGYGMFGISQWWQDLIDYIIDWYSIRVTYYTD